MDIHFNLNTLPEQSAVKQTPRRGKLKIFLGYATGVGKTTAMLQAARQLQSQDVDVAVGCLETNGLAGMEALLDCFESIPPGRAIVEAATYPELDIDAVLARRPALVLVGGLAHGNVPRSRHTRRYQDILELINAGIDVYTTLNIGNLASLNDVVAKITGTTIHETVPDHIFDNADEIELVDLPVSELLDRLKTGKIHIPSQTEAEIHHFYRPGNLIALREMAFRRAANRTDEQLHTYMQSHAIAGPWPAGECILVCVGPSPLSERLVRTARRLAQRLDAEWIAAYVETPLHRQLSDADRGRVLQTLRLAEDLGAQTITLSGQTIAETITTFAKNHNVTKIVAGKSLRSRWSELWHGSPIDQIIRQSQDIDVYVISSRTRQGSSVLRSPDLEKLKQWRPFLWSAILVGLATLVGLPLRTAIEPTNLILPYLLAVILVAVRFGRYPAILTSVLGVVVFDLVLVPPYYKLAVADAEYLLTFFGLLAVSLVISALTASAHEQELAARQRESQTAALYRLSQKLAAVSSLSDIVVVAVNHVQETVDGAVGLLLSSGDTQLSLQAASFGFQLEAEGIKTADWVLHQGRPAGRYTDTLSTTNGHYLPLQTSRRVVGVMAIHFPGSVSDLTGEQRRLLESFASQIALAIDRAQLAEQARQNRMLEETEKLQAALLNSISHDLRTPLATITGALSSLHDDAHLLSPDARQNLVLAAWEEAQRLNQLVGNLLDITRLESGALKVNQGASDVQDLVGAALAQIPHRLRRRQVEVQIPDDLPAVNIDLALMVQALVNLIDNALKYSPEDVPIHIRARQEKEAVLIEVADHGPGVPGEELERIFDKFFRVGTNGVSGTGLGLSISKGIVEAHNGRIRARNQKEGGLVVEIRLEQAEEG